MAAIALVGENALDGVADQRLDLGNDGRQCVAVIDPMGSGWRPADWQNEVA